MQGSSQIDILHDNRLQLLAPLAQSLKISPAIFPPMRVPVREIAMRGTHALGLL